MPKRKVNVNERILEVLGENNRVRWSELLRKAGVSKGALSTHLNQLIKNKLITREVDGSTRPPTVYYRRRRIYYTENLETLTPVSDTFALLFKKARALAPFVKLALSILDTQLMMEEHPRCLTYSLHSSQPIEDEENLKKHVKLALTYILANFIDDPEYIEEVANVDFTISFRLNRDAIEKMRQEKETEEKEREKIKIRQPPDPRDYISNTNKNQ